MDKIIIIKDLIWEFDNDGWVFNILMIICKFVEDSNDMSVYIYCIIDGGFFFSIVGFKLNFEIVRMNFLFFKFFNDLILFYWYYI